MDIEKVNDYLLEQVTGLTRQEIERDVTEIKRVHEEVRFLESRLSELISLIEVETKKEEELRSKIDCLNRILPELTKKHSKMEVEFQNYVTEVPLLRAEAEAYTESIKQIRDELEERLKSVTEGEVNLAKEKFELVKKATELEKQAKQNIIDTLKLKKSLVVLSESKNLIKAYDEKPPAHIRKIQAALNKRGIQLDVMKEIRMV